MRFLLRAFVFSWLHFMRTIPRSHVEGFRPVDRSTPGFSLMEVLFVCALTGIISAMALPMMSKTASNFRLSGGASGLSSAASLAKLRAASAFTQARLYVDLTANGFHVETWRKTGMPAWVTEGGTTTLPSQNTFSFGVVSSAPPNSQDAIAQAPACRDNAGNLIGNTACILFNSRGIPVDSTGAPTAVDALYVTDGTAVYGLTLSANGLIKLWRTNPTATPSWVQQ